MIDLVVIRVVFPFKIVSLYGSVLFIIQKGFKFLFSIPWTVLYSQSKILLLRLNKCIFFFSFTTYTTILKPHERKWLNSINHWASSFTSKGIKHLLKPWTELKLLIRRCCWAVDCIVKAWEHWRYPREPLRFDDWIIKCLNLT